MNTDFLLRQIENLRLGAGAIESEGVGPLVEQILGILAFLRTEARYAIEELDLNSRSERSSDLWPLSISKEFSDDAHFKEAIVKYTRLNRDSDQMLYHILLKSFFRELVGGTPMNEAVERTLEIVHSELRPESVQRLEKKLNRLVNESS